MRVYVNTSAYVKEFSEEKGTETVRKIFNACEAGKVNIVTSLWTLSESIAAVDRKFRRGEISLDDNEITIATIIERSILLARKGSLFLVMPRAELMVASWRLIVSKHVSADDALQLFSSIVSLCTIFIAADDLLVRIAKEEELESFNIEEEKDCKRLRAKLKL